jgi:hypothetical protein
VYVARRSMPMCREKVTPYEMHWPIGCNSQNPMQRLRPTEDSSPSWLENARLSPVERASLAESFRSRNGSAQALPALQASQVEFIDWDDTNLSREVPAGGLTLFSLPGYADADTAVVYAFQYCRGCGYEHLFVVRRVGPSWAVRAKASLSWIY